MSYGEHTRNPYVHDFDRVPEPDDHTCPACGDGFERDETVAFVGVDKIPVHPSCAAICCGCSELGMAKDMLRIGAAHWVHRDCLADEKVIYEQYQAQRADERRDDFNERRR